MPPNPVERAKDHLVRPFSLRGLSLPNRVVMAPMTREFSPGGVPGDDVARYYARRAAGGVGLIITEGTYVGHDSAGNSARVPHFHGDEALAGWSAVADAVHKESGRIMPQLWHVGMDRTPGNPPVPDAPAIGPSGIGLDGTRSGHAMTQADIDNVVAAYASAAAAAEALGFDGVEIHGGHGYLIDQFLWSHTNRRTDGYGGDVAGRTRFAAEVVAACRAAVSDEFPISFRFSQWKVNHYDARIVETPQELETFLGLLAEAGADVFHCSTRRFHLPEFEGSDLNLAGWAKKVSGKPAISVGSVGLSNEFLQVFQGEQARVTDIEGLLDRMERDEFDLVAVGRALLGDPEWLAKVLSGRHDELTPFHVGLVGSLA
ncbi:NADH:flavin oxidoreductase [Streptomyces sp. NRRL B-3648]|uniref:NADH:flavin oxidoreductase n=1 Tax=Streptomyces sp. NRRL B-3648 TaxID=1519493 RepID=UPI0006AF3574|nr:NADH:flavin oxidoreductase [Streptomyces sp. NRRL B-3648]KOV93763.1 1,2-oxophytodienoate reductase [Streptomyces sp. NRRL B-3648]